ncbi:LPXTG cell wall anchor domain-containing protein [Ruoffia tabacinasalis]|uniref:LPXTG cell wall anchor domain-containing protein n=1 Tax=Ruoffia tabacinasalis TaxID=87458 RepID=A0ABS0LLX5_9LACT|nr:LPXTG cell wall anchor domain-containing protein [Ruoffia tabacinasalis]MBG9979247.1 LPXTG cell wall anchor domain-containing protein [Ruoffia tabacinasalis]
MSSSMGKKSLKNSLMFRSSSLLVVAGLALMANSQDVKAQDDAVVTESIVEEVVVFEEALPVVEEVVEEETAVIEEDEAVLDEVVEGDVISEAIESAIVEEVEAEESTDKVDDASETIIEAESDDNMQFENSIEVDVTEELKPVENLSTEVAEDKLVATSFETQNSPEAVTSGQKQFPEHNSQTAKNIADQRDYEFAEHLKNNGFDPNKPEVFYEYLESLDVELQQTQVLEENLSDLYGKYDTLWWNNQISAEEYNTFLSAYHTKVYDYQNQRYTLNDRVNSFSYIQSNLDYYNNLIQGLETVEIIENVSPDEETRLFNENYQKLKGSQSTVQNNISTIDAEITDIRELLNENSLSIESMEDYLIQMGSKRNEKSELESELSSIHNNMSSYERFISYIPGEYNSPWPEDPVEEEFSWEDYFNNVPSHNSEVGQILDEFRDKLIDNHLKNNGLEEIQFDEYLTNIEDIRNQIESNNEQRLELDNLKQLYHDNYYYKGLLTSQEYYLLEDSISQLIWDIDSQSSDLHSKLDSFNALVNNFDRFNSYINLLIEENILEDAEVEGSNNFDDVYLNYKELINSNIKQSNSIQLEIDNLTNQLKENIFTSDDAEKILKQITQKQAEISSLNTERYKLEDKINKFDTIKNYLPIDEAPEEPEEETTSWTEYFKNPPIHNSTIGQKLGEIRNQGIVDYLENLGIEADSFNDYLISIDEMTRDVEVYNQEISKLYTMMNDYNNKAYAREITWDDYYIIQDAIQNKIWVNENKRNELDSELNRFNNLVNRYDEFNRYIDFLIDQNILEDIDHESNNSFDELYLSNNELLNLNNNLQNQLNTELAELYSQLVENIYSPEAIDRLVDEINQKKYEINTLNNEYNELQSIIHMFQTIRNYVPVEELPEAPEEDPEENPEEDGRTPWAEYFKNTPVHNSEIGQKLANARDQQIEYYLRNLGVEEENLEEFFAMMDDIYSQVDYYSKENTRLSKLREDYYQKYSYGIIDWQEYQLIQQAIESMSMNNYFNSDKLISEYSYFQNMIWTFDSYNSRIAFLIEENILEDLENEGSNSIEEVQQHYKDQLSEQISVRNNLNNELNIIFKGLDSNNLPQEILDSILNQITQKQNEIYSMNAEIDSTQQVLNKLNEIKSYLADGPGNTVEEPENPEQPNEEPENPEQPIEEPEEERTSLFDYFNNPPIHNSQTGQNIAEKRDYELAKALEELGITVDNMEETLLVFDEKQNLIDRYEMELDNLYEIMNSLYGRNPYDENELNYMNTVIDGMFAKIENYNNKINSLNLELNAMNKIKVDFDNYNKIIELLDEGQQSDEPWLTDEVLRFNQLHQFYQNQLDELSNIKFNLKQELSNLLDQAETIDLTDEGNWILFNQINEKNSEIENIDNSISLTEGQLDNLEVINKYLPENYQGVEFDDENDESERNTFVSHYIQYTPKLPDVYIPTTDLKVGEIRIVSMGREGRVLVTHAPVNPSKGQWDSEILFEKVIEEATATIIEYGVAEVDEEVDSPDDEGVVLPGDNEDEDSEVIDDTPDEEENGDPEETEDEEIPDEDEDDNSDEASEGENSSNNSDPSEDDKDEETETDNNNVGGSPIVKPNNPSNGGTPTPNAPDVTEGSEVDEDDDSETSGKSDSDANDSLDLDSLFPEEVSINHSGVMLPQTGENNSNLWFAGSAAAVLLGLGLITSRKEETE